ncbi:epimerase family protein SDR39U1 [Grus japonensis]|uniref:Epimerase family protein SDR39U1 n=1 Tax=Grus japonensis TaxID=30415 RepID=A0ABC9XS85_GRUJA
MPAGSKTDPPLAKAEPIRVLCDNILKKGKNQLRENFCSRREEREDVRNSADTKVSADGGGGGAPGAGAEIPLQPVVKAMVKQAVPLQPMEEG